MPLTSSILRPVELEEIPSRSRDSPFRRFQPHNKSPRSSLVSIAYTHAVIPPILCQGDKRQSIELTPGSKKSIERSLERPGKPKSPAERAAAQEGRTVKPAAPDSSTERQTAEVPADGVFRIGPTRKFTRPSQVSKGSESRMAGMSVSA